MASDDVEMEIPRFPVPEGVGHPESSGVDDPPGDEAPSPTAVITETVSVVAADGSSGIKPASEIEPTPEAATPEIMSSRAYQLEMLDQSLQRNVIVAVCRSLFKIECDDGS